MNAPRGALLIAGLAVLAACPERAPASRTRAAIAGGTATAADPAVFLLDIRSDTGHETLCSATLIAPRTLLSAAHCVDPSMVGGSALTVLAANVPSRAEVQPGLNTFSVVEVRRHPAWDPARNLDADLALLRIADPPSSSPSPWSAADLSPLGGTAVRAVGYGASSPDAGDLGLKRTVDLTLRQLTAERILLGDLVARGLCHGDSGGPVFHTFDDGVERLIGVHNFTRGDACVDGAATRLDAYADFVRQGLSDHEDTCGPDGVCSATTCAVPDLDCAALGAPCDTPFACPGRRCVTDAQHPQPYCSKACAAPGDCPAPLACDAARGQCQQPQRPLVPEGEACSAGFCEGRCVEDSEGLARCRRRCTSSSECRSGQECQRPGGGAGVCLEPPPLIAPLAPMTGPAAGCATAPGLALAVGLALLRRRNRRVRAAGRPRNC